MTRLRGRRGHWKHRVPVPQSRIAQAERWLRDRSIRFVTGFWLYNGCYVVRLPNADDAVLFKLTWGGA